MKNPPLRATVNAILLAVSTRAAGMGPGEVSTVRCSVRKGNTTTKRTNQAHEEDENHRKGHASGACLGLSCVVDQLDVRHAGWGCEDAVNLEEERNRVKRVSLTQSTK